MIQRVREMFGRRLGVIAIALAGAVATSGAAVAQEASGGASASEVLAAAEHDLTSGDLVRAKRALLSLDRDRLTDAQRERAFELMMGVDRRLRFADAVDVSLQKAEVALEEGDIRAAERHAKAARGADGADEGQIAEAEVLLRDAHALREQMRPLAESALRQATLDFERGDYGAAKAALDSVYRSGADLSPDDLRTLTRYRERIGEIERSRGEVFSFRRVSLGMLQPGRVRDREDPSERAEREQQEQPAEQGEEAQQQEPGEAQGQEEFVDLPEPTQEARQPAPTQRLFEEALTADADQVLAEADIAFQEGRYNEALTKYEQIAGQYRRYVSEEDLERAQNRIAEVRTLLEQAGGDLIEQEVQRRELRAELARAEFDNFLAEARTALAAGDVERARSLVEQARVRLADARDLLSEEEYNRRLDQQQSLLQQIIEQEEQIAQREAEQREERLAEEAQRQEHQRAQEKQRKIAEALDRVRSLQLEQKYEQALQVVEQILFLDPQHPAGLLLQDTLQDVMIYRSWDQIQRRKNLSYARESIEIQESMVMPERLLNYPSDWPELSFRRGAPSAFAESEADRRVLAELESKRIPASFADNRLEDVINFIATVTNLDVDVDWDSLADIGVDRDDLVTLDLQPLPARVILDRVLEKVSPDAFSRANWAVQDGIVVVASDQALRQNTFIVIYDVRDLLFDIPDFTEAPRLDLDSVLGQAEGGGGGGSIFEDEEAEGEQLTKEELKERLREIIQTTVDFEGWRDNGGDTGIIQELNDNFIITNTARNHRSISNLLRQLREVRSIQINVEARFLTVSQDFFEQVAFDLDVIFNAEDDQFNIAQSQQRQFQNLATVGGQSALLPSDVASAFFPTFGTSSRFGSTSDFVVTNPDDVEMGETPEIGVNTPNFVATAPDGFSMLPVFQSSNEIVSRLNTSDFASMFLGMNPALQLVGTYLDDIQVDFLVEATQADRRSVTMNAPRLTFTNGNGANIFVVTQRSFVSDLNPLVGTNSVSFDPTVDVVNDGFSLTLNGVVSADRRYVTLAVETAIARFVQFDEAQVSAQTGGGTDVGAPSEPVTDTFQLPIIEVSSISTGATIPDKGTLLVGGQRLSTEFEVESGVPVLSKLPIINRFFTNRFDAKEEETLFILIKPQIIIQSEEEENNFPGLLDRLESQFGGF